MAADSGAAGLLQFARKDIPHPTTGRQQSSSTARASRAGFRLRPVKPSGGAFRRGPPTSQASGKARGLTERLTPKAWATSSSPSWTRRESNERLWSALLFGCQVAVACAFRHPARVERVVLQGPAAAPQDHGCSRLVQLSRQNGKQEPSDMRLTASEYRRAGFRRVRDAFNHYRTYPMESAVRQIEQPTLIIRRARPLGSAILGGVPRPQRASRPPCGRSGRGTYDEPVLAGRTRRSVEPLSPRRSLSRGRGAVLRGSTTSLW